jgi:hypothetical protein
VLAGVLASSSAAGHPARPRTPTPSVTIELPTGKLGGRNAVSVQAWINAKRGGSLRACYRKELDRDPSLGGTLVVQLDVDIDGKVTNAQLTRKTTNHVPLESCVLRQYLKFKLQPTGKPASFRVATRFWLDQMQ